MKKILTVFFSQVDCEEFIIESIKEGKLDNNVLLAYTKLIQYAFKSDLSRLCLLYINGGIYLDIK